MATNGDPQSGWSFDSNDPIVSGLRGLATMVLSYLAGKGIITAGDIPSIMSGLGAIALVGWGVYAKRKNAIIASAASREGVTHILVDSKMTAAEIPSEKVQSAGPLAPQVEALMTKVAAQ